MGWDCEVVPVQRMPVGRLRTSTFTVGHRSGHNKVRPASCWGQSVWHVANRLERDKGGHGEPRLVTEALQTWPCPESHLRQMRSRRRWVSGKGCSVGLHAAEPCKRAFGLAPWRLSDLGQRCFQQTEVRQQWKQFKPGGQPWRRRALDKVEKH